MDHPYIFSKIWYDHPFHMALPLGSTSATNSPDTGTRVYVMHAVIPTKWRMGRIRKVERHQSRKKISDGESRAEKSEIGAQISYHGPFFPELNIVCLQASSWSRSITVSSLLAAY
jgi:hypothetical protein